MRELLSQAQKHSLQVLLKEARCQVEVHLTRLTLIGLPILLRPFVCFPSFQEEPRANSDSFILIKEIVGTVL